MKLREKVVALLQDCIDKLRQRETIELDVMVWRQQLASELGGNVKLLHVELMGLEMELERVMGHTNLRDFPNKTDYKKMEERKQLIRFNINERRKALTKAIKQHPIVLDDLAKLENDRNDLADIMESTLQEFNLNGTVRSLQEKVDVLKSQGNRQIKLQNEQACLTKAIEETKAVLNAEKLSTDIIELDKEIEEVREEISQLTSAVTPSAFHERLEVAIQIKNKSVFYGGENKVEQDIERLKHRITDEEIVHDRNREKMIKYVAELESEVSKSRRYAEEELSSLNMRHARLFDERENCLTSLLSLRRRYDNENHLEEVRKQERLLQEKRLKDEIEFEEKRYFAAYKLQRMYRSFLRQTKKPIKKKKTKKTKK